MPHRGQKKHSDKIAMKERKRMARSAEARAWFYAVSKFLAALAAFAAAVKLLVLGV